MQQSRTWEADSSWLSQEVVRLLHGPKGHDSVQKSPSLALPRATRASSFHKLIGLIYLLSQM
jgi:hypothetical protein